MAAPAPAKKKKSKRKSYEPRPVDEAEIPLTFCEFLKCSNAMSVVTKNLEICYPNEQNEFNVRNNCRKCYLLFYTRPEIRSKRPLKYIKPTGKCPPPLRRVFFNVPERFEHLLPKLNSKDLSTTPRTKQCVTLDEKARGDRAREERRAPNDVTSKSYAELLEKLANQHSSGTPTKERIPVTLECFKAHTHWQEIVDKVIRHFVSNDESRFAELSQDQTFCNRIIQNYFNEFYMHPNIRKMLMVQLKPCPGIVKKKLLQSIVSPLSDDTKSDRTSSNLSVASVPLTVESKASEEPPSKLRIVAAESEPNRRRIKMRQDKAATVEAITISTTESDESESPHSITAIHRPTLPYSTHTRIQTRPMLPQAQSRPLHAPRSPFTLSAVRLPQATVSAPAVSHADAADAETLVRRATMSNAMLNASRAQTPTVPAASSKPQQTVTSLQPEVEYQCEAELQQRCNQMSESLVIGAESQMTSAPKSLSMSPVKSTSASSVTSRVKFDETTFPVTFKEFMTHTNLSKFAHCKLKQKLKNDPSLKSNVLDVAHELYVKFYMMPESRAAEFKHLKILLNSFYHEGWLEMAQRIQKVPESLQSESTETPAPNNEINLTADKDAQNAECMTESNNCLNAVPSAPKQKAQTNAVETHIDAEEPLQESTQADSLPPDKLQNANAFEASCSDEFLLQYLTGKACDPSRHAETLKRIKDQLLAKLPTKPITAAAAAIAMAAAAPIAVTETPTATVATKTLPPKVYIQSVQVLKPLPLPLEVNAENRLHEAELIFFRKVDRCHSFRNMMRCCDGVRRDILRAVMQMSLDEFAKYTRIHNAPEFYNDPNMLQRCYQHAIVTWPINLYMRQIDLLAYLETKTIVSCQPDLTDISPKLLHWADLMITTDFDKAVEMDYLHCTSKRIESDDALQRWRQNYYNRCWSHDQWIWAVPHVTDAKLMLILTTTKLFELSRKESAHEDCNISLAELFKKVIARKECVERENSSLQTAICEADAAHTIGDTAVESLQVNPMLTETQPHEIGAESASATQKASSSTLRADVSEVDAMEEEDTQPFDISAETVLATQNASSKKCNTLNAGASEVDLMQDTQLFDCRQRQTVAERSTAMSATVNANTSDNTTTMPSIQAPASDIEHGARCHLPAAQLTPATLNEATQSEERVSFLNRLTQYSYTIRDASRNVFTSTSGSTPQQISDNKQSQQAEMISFTNSSPAAAECGASDAGLLAATMASNCAVKMELNDSQSAAVAHNSAPRENRLLNNLMFCLDSNDEQIHCMSIVEEPILIPDSDSPLEFANLRKSIAVSLSEANALPRNFQTLSRFEDNSIALSRLAFSTVPPSTEMQQMTLEILSNRNIDVPQLVEKTICDCGDPATSVDAGRSTMATCRSFSVSQALATDCSLFNNTQLLQFVDQQRQQQTQTQQQHQHDHTYSCRKQFNWPSGHVDGAKQLQPQVAIVANPTLFPSVARMHEILLYRKLVQFHYFRSLTAAHISKYDLTTTALGKRYMHATLRHCSGNIKIDGDVLSALLLNCSRSLHRDLEHVLQEFGEFHYNRHSPNIQRTLRERVLRHFLNSLPSFCHCVVEFDSSSRDTARSKCITTAMDTMRPRNSQRSLAAALKPSILKRIAQVKGRLQPSP